MHDISKDGRAVELMDWTSDVADDCSMIVVTTESDLPLIKRYVNLPSLKFITLTDLSKHNILEFGESTGLLTSGKAYVLGSVSTSETGKVTLGSAKKELELLCIVLPYEHFCIQEDISSFFLWLANRSIQLSQIVLADSVRTRRAMATLRHEHEQTLESFADLESAANMGTARRYLKVEYLPSHAKVHLGKLRNQSVSQRLPVSPSGIALIELHFVSHREPVIGTMAMKLFAGGSLTPIKKWSVHVTNHPSGWYQFWLDRALIASGMDARVELTWIAASEDTELELSLSVPSPLDEFCASNMFGTTLAAALAIKVWGAPPGSLVSTRDAICEENEDSISTVTEYSESSSLRYALGVQELSQAKVIWPTSLQSFNIVEFRYDHLDLLVHPVEGGPTVAALKQLDFRSIKAISAIVLVDNKDANPIEFGLAVVRHQEVFTDPASFIKTWTTVSPLVHSEVRGTVEVGDNSDDIVSYDILLAARVAGGRSANCAWAFFKRVEVVA